MVFARPDSSGGWCAMVPVATLALSACQAGARPTERCPTAVTDRMPSPGSTASVEGSPPELRRISYQSAATHAERDYFLYLPRGYHDAGRQRWPVIVVLHGNGERGDGKADLDFLLKNGPLYEAWIQKHELPFVIAAPQLPMYGQDAKADYLKNRSRDEIPVRLEHGVPDRPPAFSRPPTMTGAVSAELPSDQTPYGPPMGWPELEDDVLGIIATLLRDGGGDPSRVYLTGMSYGGFGTWYLASKHPELFAALVPVVGYGHPDLMEPIARAKIPVWCFAGGGDETVPVKYFYPGLNRLKALGNPPRFTIEEDLGHDVWTRVYAGRDLYDWLLAHARPTCETHPAHGTSVQCRTSAP